MVDRNLPWRNDGFYQLRHQAKQEFYHHKYTNILHTHIYTELLYPQLYCITTLNFTSVYLEPDFYEVTKLLFF